MKKLRFILLACMVIICSMSVSILAGTKKNSLSKSAPKTIITSSPVKANIVVQSFAYKPAPLKEGSNIDMYITFKNKGGVKSSKNAKYKISCSIIKSSSYSKECPIPNTVRKFKKQIMPGKTLSVRLLGARPAKPGTYKIIVAIPGNTGRPFTKILKVIPDKSNKIAKKNNKGHKKFVQSSLTNPGAKKNIPTPGIKANITVQSFAYKPAPLKEGSNIDMYITFKNKGGVKSSKNAKYKISCSIIKSSSSNKECPIPYTVKKFKKQIMPGKTLSVRLLGARPAKPGTYKIIVAILGSTNRPFTKILKVLPKNSFKKATNFKKHIKKAARKGVAKGVEQGIQITTPSRADKYLPGDNITLNFRFRHDVDVSDIREILLYKGTALAYTVPASRIPSPSRTMSTTFQLPDNLPFSNNYNIVIQASYATWGQSENFPIGFFAMVGTMRSLPPHGLRITVEGNPSLVNIGDNITVNMEITDPEAPGFSAPSLYQSGYDFYIFIHPENQRRERMGFWYMPDWTIISRSSDYRSMRVRLNIGESFDEDENYVVFFNHTTNIYGDSLPFSIRPRGISTNSINVTEPVSETIWHNHQNYNINFTLYDRSDGSGLHALVELLKYPEMTTAAGLTGSGKAHKPTVVNSQTIVPVCWRTSQGIQCRLPYDTPEGTNSNSYRAGIRGKNYKLRITLTERGGEKIVTGYSDKFAILNISHAMDIDVRQIKVDETGQVQVEYRVQCREPFSARVPFTIEWVSHGNATEVPVLVNSENQYVWADLGHINRLKPASAEGHSAICRITANKEKIFFESYYSNNQEEKRIPLIAKMIYFNFYGSDVSPDTFYYHDYQRSFCCESVAGFQIHSVGYQTVTGTIEIRQTGTWGTGRSGTLSPPSYHDNHLVTTDYTIAPGTQSNFGQIVQRSSLPGLLWTYSDLVFIFSGEFADFISPNPAVRHLRHRDGT